MSVIRERSSQPFFAYLALQHASLTASHCRTAFAARRDRGSTASDVIEAIDWSAGQVAQALDETGQSDDTIVIFTSDNGPWLNLPDRMLSGGVVPWHAVLARASPGCQAHHLRRRSAGPFHRPLARHRAAGHGNRGEWERRWTCTPPCWRLAAGRCPPTPTGTTSEGCGLGAPAQSPRREFIYHRGGNVQGIRAGPWKLRIIEGEELFHLDRDPSERYNVAAEHPEIVAQLRRRIDQFTSRVAAEMDQAP